MEGNVFELGDHLAKTCTCGSIRFLLLVSRKVECAGCGATFPVAWVWESEAAARAAAGVPSGHA